MAAFLLIGIWIKAMLMIMSDEGGKENKMTEDIITGMKHYIFADTENSANNIPNFVEFLNKNNCLTANTQIICFIGADKSYNNYYETLKSKLTKQKSMNVTPIRINDTSKNALDKILITYLGIAIGKNQSANFTIFSNDNDYSSVIKFFSSKGIKLKAEKTSDLIKSTKGENTKKSEKNNQKTNVISSTQIKEIARKIYNQKSSRPVKLKTLRKRINQYQKKYHFTDKTLNSVSEMVRKELLSTSRISLNNEKIIWT